MEKKRYITETFNDFIKYSSALNEKESGISLSVNGAKDLVIMILKDNIELSLDMYDYAKKKKDSNRANDKRDYIRYEAAKALENGNPIKGGLYLLLVEANEKSFSNTESNKKETIAKLGINVDSDDLGSEIERFKETIPEMEDDKAKELLIEAIKTAKFTVFAGSTGLRINIFWSLLSTTEKEEVYENFEKEARKRGYSTVGSIEGKIKKHFNARKNKRNFMRSPGIRVATEKEITPMIEKTEGKTQKTWMLKEDQMSDVFKQNETGANGKVDFIDSTFDIMVTNLGSIFKRLGNEITTITKINIYTSCDRYRNTKNSENLSWGQLAYARSLAIKEIIGSVALASGVDDELVNIMHKLITLYNKGENGDGTSGPNPPEGIKFGYYIEAMDKVSFMEGKNRSNITIIPVNEEGTPKLSNSKGSDIKDADPLLDKHDYDSYRYNNIEIEYKIIDPAKPESTLDGGKIIDLTYPVIIKLPPRHGYTTINIKIPEIGISRIKKGKLDGHGCSTFNQTSKTSFGLQFKKIQIARFKTN